MISKKKSKRGIAGVFPCRVRKGMHKAISQIICSIPPEGSKRLHSQY